MFPSLLCRIACSCWHLNKAILTKLKVWEWTFLRKTFRWRKRIDEGSMGYNQRTSALITLYFKRYNVAPLFIRVLRSVYKHAWRERSYPMTGKHNLLASARRFWDRLWWEAFKGRNNGNLYRQRKRENLLHAFAGTFTHWEDIFCELLGVDWRNTCLDRAKTMAD